jgi:hypothetical protein
MSFPWVNVRPSPITDPAEKFKMHGSTLNIERRMLNLVHYTPGYRCFAFDILTHVGHHRTVSGDRSL